MDNLIFEDNLIKVEIEPFEIPWVKIFTQEKIKEFSQCNKELRLYILDTLDIIEKIMLEELKCDKINIASFGNYVPHVHFHIQARFKNDSYFPEPIWGEKQRIGQFSLNNIENFYKKIQKILKSRSKK